MYGHFRFHSTKNIIVQNSYFENGTGTGFSINRSSNIILRNITTRNNQSTQGGDYWFERIKNMTITDMYSSSNYASGFMGSFYLYSGEDIHISNT